jgi:hypothetical protein
MVSNNSYIKQYREFLKKTYNVDLEEDIEEEENTMCLLPPTTENLKGINDLLMNSSYSLVKKSKISNECLADDVR